jgi:hypothetical protein
MFCNSDFLPSARKVLLPSVHLYHCHFYILFTKYTSIIEPFDLPLNWNERFRLALQSYVCMYDLSTGLLSTTLKLVKLIVCQPVTALNRVHYYFDALHAHSFKHPYLSSGSSHSLNYDYIFARFITGSSSSLRLRLEKKVPLLRFHLQLP